MDFRYLKILMIGLALVFATQGCAEYLHRDYLGDYHYRHDPPKKPEFYQFQAQNSRHLEGHEQMIR